LQADISFLTPAELAELLRVSNSTLRNWRRRREGPPYVTIPINRVLYPVEEFELWLKTRETLPRHKRPTISRREILASYANIVSAVASVATFGYMVARDDVKSHPANATLARAVGEGRSTAEAIVGIQMQGIPSSCAVGIPTIGTPAIIGSPNEAPAYQYRGNHYCSVEARRETWRARRHPKAANGVLAAKLAWVQLRHPKADAVWVKAFAAGE